MKKFELVSVFLIPLIEWGAEGYMVGNNPHRQRETLDPRGKYVLEWEVDMKQERITFNVTVETTGYVGFGLSSNGKMTGADIVIGGVMLSGKWYFSDRHAVATQVPEENPSQDWKLLEARESKSYTFLSFSRAFDTCDQQDYPITEDKISIIWAYGEKDEQLAYHHRNRGVFDAYLLHPNYAPPIIRDEGTGQPLAVDLEQQVRDNYSSTGENIQIWTINHAMQLPPRETSYWCTMHKCPQLSGKHHIVGLDIRLEGATSIRHTHHLQIFKCNALRGQSAQRMFHSWLGRRGQECLMVKAPTGPMPTEYCTEFYQSWAVGGRILWHPPHVGIPVGSDPDEYYLLQIHFDNPNSLTGVDVNVSVDMFYTEKLRPNDGGMLMIRHESPGLTPSILITPNSVDHRLYGMCGKECSQRFIPPEGIIFYSMFMHTHNAGERLRLQQFRGQKELPWVLSDDNYSFNYQQFRVLTKEVRVLPGDQLVVRCVYESTRANRTVVGGFGTQEEMCTAFGYYYNKIWDYQQCSSEIDSSEARQRFLGIGNVTWSNPDVEFIVSPPHPLAGRKVSDVSDNFVEWDSERREELQTFHLNHPHVNRCPRERYAVEGDDDDNDEVSGFPGNTGGSLKKRKLKDGTSENSEDDPGRLVFYPYEAIPYTPKQRCSLR